MNTGSLTVRKTRLSLSSFCPPSLCWRAPVCSLFHTAIVLLLWPTAAWAEPTKLATTGRFDLSADAKVGSIEDGQVLVGSGSVERMNWLPESDRPRGYTVSFSISHLAWREFAVRFTPKSSGPVTLKPMGPWEEQSKGVVYQQEVLWDAIEASGTSISDGGFDLERRLNQFWRFAGGTKEYATDAVPAVNGNRYARTWHNRSISATLHVTSGKPVAIRLHARAQIPDGFQEMRRIAGRDTLAHQAAKRFMRGTNLGNYLEAPPGGLREALLPNRRN